MNRALCLAAVLSACASAPPPAPPPPPPPPPEPTASQRLQELSDMFWEELMRRSPTWATELGDRRFDAELPEVSAASIADHLTALGSLRGQLSRIDRATLTEAERVTAEVLDEELGARLEVARGCKGWLWQVDQLSGPQLDLPRLSEIHTVENEKHGADLVTRYEKAGKLLADHVDNLRTGLAEGRVAPRGSVERVIVQLEDQLKVPAIKSPYLAVTFGDTVGEEQRRALLAKLATAVDASIYPGLTAYRDFLKKELLPKARKEPGIKTMPGGDACYAAQIRAQTGTTKTAAEIHQLGLDEVKRIEGEMLALARTQKKGTALKPYLAALAKRKDQYVRTREELVAYNQALLDKALAALPRAFKTLPRTKVEVKPLEAYQEKDAPAAYYFPAPPDAGRPAYYRLNTYAPNTRPKYNQPALAFHEAVPGHHLQGALQQENASLHPFRRQLGHTAFVEGWALYAESLANELGLYATPEEQLGRLNYELWRAVRLVVDTGIHDLGWSRDKAIAYFREHTLNPAGEIANEVDRYIIWPGQALAYKLGQLEISRLRREAEARLGPKFSLPGFHDLVLRDGAVPPTVLARKVEAWTGD